MAQDTNNDGTVDISDAVYQLAFLFISGPPLPAPFPDCGADVTTDSLDCLDPMGCP